MSIISSIFNAFFKPKPSAAQRLDSMLQEISENPSIAKALGNAKSEYDQICKIKEIFVDMSAWSDRASGIMDQLGHINMNDLDQYSMASFYHDIGSIVYWTLISMKKEEPDFDIFDPEEVKLTLEELMNDLAEKTDDFEVIDPQYIKERVEIAKQDAKG